MAPESNKWKILIADDEELIHEGMEMNLRNMEYNHKKVELIHSYSASDSKNIIKNNPDISVIILDVMMEEDSAGLDFVKFIRDEIKNDNVRILLHTGQPGIAPKKEVASEYLIDAYLDKNIVSNDDSYAAVKLALRSYKERLDLKKSVSKSDSDLLSEIADNYIHLLNNYPQEKHEEVLSKINLMVNASQEILASYVMQDLKQDLVLGSTKSQRLSFDDYSALIQIHNLKIILTQTADQYQKEKVIIFDTISNAAKNFLQIKILPESSKDKLEKCLKQSNF